MKTYIKIPIVLFTLTAAVMLFQSCGKQHRTGKVSVKMTDAPIDFDSVNVEVLQVKVHVSNSGNGSSGWVDLPTNTGMYNLLDLQNDITTTLVDPHILSVGEIQQMRLILGANNYVVVDSIPFPLETSSQMNTGLKFNVNTAITPNDEVEILIDFDAEQSIVIEGTGDYKLKPVIKVEAITYL